MADRNMLHHIVKFKFLGILLPGLLKWILYNRYIYIYDIYCIYSYMCEYMNVLEHVFTQYLLFIKLVTFNGDNDR